MLGCDVRTMEDPIRDMLTNREVLAIHADAGCQPFPATKCKWGDDTLAWAKQLSDGGYALLYANMTDNAQLINTNWWDLGLPPASGFAFAVRDVWAGRISAYSRRTARSRSSRMNAACSASRSSRIRVPRRERAALRPVRPSSRRLRHRRV